MTRFTEGYLLYLLAQASGRASAAFHAQLADRGIAVSTWRILATLYPDDPASISELCAACLAKQPTMTRQVDRLATAGLVTRETTTGDRRRVTVQLTGAGHDLAEELVAQAKSHEAAILDGTAPEEVARVKALLRALAAGRLPSGRPEG